MMDLLLEHIQISIIRGQFYHLLVRMVIMILIGQTQAEMDL